MDISKFQGLEEIEFSELKCIFDGLIKNGVQASTMQQLH